MGQFNEKVLGKLALTVDPKNNNSMEVYGKLGGLGFDVDGLFDVYQFRNALFKLLMVRAKDVYVETGQGKKPEKDREVTITLNMTIHSTLIHTDEQLVEHGIVESLEEAQRLRGGIPIVAPEPSDGLEASTIVNMINSGDFILACD